MSLLREIQASLMQESPDIGSLLLKLRFLASRLGSDKLEEWVHYEMDGYPAKVALPDYRQLAVSYKGAFSGPLRGDSVPAAPIPPFLIEKYAGEDFLVYNESRGVGAVDHLIRENTSKSGTLSFEAADFILRLQGKVYPGMACHSVTGYVSIADLAGLVLSVRNRVLNLTIELEKSVPAATAIVIDQQAAQLPEEETTTVSHITHQVIYGDQNVISSSGANAQLTVHIGKRDSAALIKALTEGGIPESDAREFADILSKEQPTSKEEPLGEGGTKWFVTHIQKAAEGVWKTGVSEATKLVTKMAAQYYGLE